MDRQTIDNCLTLKNDSHVCALDQLNDGIYFSEILFPAFAYT